MADSSTSDPEIEPQLSADAAANGGEDLNAQRAVNIAGDVVGRDKVTTNIDTGGGAHVGGYVHTAEFVGRDKIIGYTAEQVGVLLDQIKSDFQLKPFNGNCPYLGLDAFSEDDADRFFGREKLITELVARVKGSRFVVVAGPSGSGKSSLVRAGLIHTLKQGALSNSDRWLYATLTPGRDPIESLAGALSRLAKSPEAGRYLREHAAEANALHEYVESQLSDRKDQRAVIFVDQFEEVFTQVSQESSRSAFLNLLTHAATIANGRVTVLFALRSDFVSNCATYPQLNALLSQQFIQVGAMQPDELVSAIARPALQVGLRIDPDLVAQIGNDMQDEPGALPLMQFALKDLFEAQKAGGGVIALTRDGYQARGGLHKALERHADAAFGQLSGDEQQLARLIFSGLIEIGRDHQDTRRTAALTELAPANVTVEQVKAVVQKLADARLVTTSGQGAKDTVTISHERLLEAWPWLRRLVDENREAIALHNQIAEDAHVWDANERDSSYLYRGRGLAAAAKWSREHEQWLTSIEWSFLKASQQARQRARLWRAFAGGVAVTITIFVIALALTESGPFQQRWAWRQVPDLVAREVQSLLWTEDNVAYAGLSRSPEQVAIVRSRDGGEHWDPLGLTGTETWALITGPDRSIYASLGEAGLFRSDNGGDNWQRIGATLPITQISALVAAPDGTLYLGDYVQASGILISRDRGETWTRETEVPTMPIYSLAWSDNQLLAGTAQGLWLKPLDGQWQRLSLNLPVVNGLGALNGSIYASSLVKGLGEVRQTPSAQLTLLYDTNVSSLDVAREPYPRVVAVAPLKVVVLEWRVQEQQLRQIADSAALADAELLNVVAIHGDVWVGADNGLHRGRLLHWYESDPQ